MSSDDTRTDNKVFIPVDRRTELRDMLMKLKELLEDSDVYDVATALRGPDLDNGIIKGSLTGRVRYFVYGRYASGVGTVRAAKFTRRTALAVIDEVRYLVEHGVFNDTHVVLGFIHYLRHVRSAVYVLQFSRLMSNEEGDLMWNFLSRLLYIFEGHADNLTTISNLRNLKKRYKGEKK